MKLPYSYRTQWFKPAVTFSVLSHLLFIGAGSAFHPSPQCGVEEAPSSMEIVILKEPEFKEEKEKEEKGVRSSIDSWQVSAHVQLSIEDLTPFSYKMRERKPEVQKPVVTPPERGALSDPRPDYLKNPAPRYPEYARERGWEGVVLLKALVGRSGTVERIQVERSSGYQILDDSALKTVRDWNFLPARAGGLTFSSWVMVPVRFMLLEE